jgi:hypothetical protein
MEYRLFDELNSSIFNLIGHDEPAQTKALGYLLARSPLAMKSFLELLFSPKDVMILMTCRWIVDCEHRKVKNQTSSQRADILIRFFNKHTPERAILLEAKGIGVPVNGNAAALQASNYLNTFPALSVFINKTVVVTLTQLRSLSSSLATSNLKMLLWQELQEKFLSISLNKKQYSLENELIKDFLFFLNKLSNAMKFYDKEVLVIPAGRTYQTIQKYLFYECAAGRMNCDARANSHPLFVAFRFAGKVSELYRIREIVRADLTDQSAVNYLTQNYQYLNGGLQQYVSGLIADYNKLTPTKQQAAAAPWDDRWVFVLEKDAIVLPQPVALKKCRNHTFTTLKALINPRSSSNAPGAPTNP